MIGYHYAPVRACIHGPLSDSRTVAVLCIPLDGPPVLVRGVLTGARAAGFSLALDELERQAHAAADAERLRPGALLEWWQARAARRADAVYLAGPMSGCGDDANDEAVKILRERQGTAEPR